jgi:hypothetical protein
MTIWLAYIVQAYFAIVTNIVTAAWTWANAFMVQAYLALTAEIITAAFKATDTFAIVIANV